MLTLFKFIYAFDLEAVVIETFQFSFIHSFSSKSR